MTLSSPYQLFTLSDYQQKELLTKGKLYEGEKKSYYHIQPYIYERTPEENGDSWQFDIFKEDSDVYIRFLNESGFPF